MEESSDDDEDVGESSDNEAEGVERAKQHCGKGSDCMCLRDASAHPSHIWIFTYKGFTTGNEWIIQQEKRNQDNFGVHIFNDWNGYGTSEVMENVFKAFDKELGKYTVEGGEKRKKDVLPLWAHIEGLALWLTRGLDDWGMSDDSEGNAKRVMLLGTMVLTAVDVLVEYDVFNATGGDGKIKNLGLVICHIPDILSSTTERNLSAE